jgi:hypothetical protein
LLKPPNPVRTAPPVDGDPGSRVEARGFWRPDPVDRHAIVPGRLAHLEEEDLGSLRVEVERAVAVEVKSAVGAGDEDVALVVAHDLVARIGTDGTVEGPEPLETFSRLGGTGPEGSDRRVGQCEGSNGRDARHGDGDSRSHLDRSFANRSPMQIYRLSVQTYAATAAI